VDADGQGRPCGAGCRHGRPAFYETKIATGRYYMARQLPACAMHLARIESGADPVMALGRRGVLSLRCKFPEERNLHPAAAGGANAQDVSA
jgi:hypothetical protein